MCFTYRACHIKKLDPCLLFTSRNPVISDSMLTLPAKESLTMDCLINEWKVEGGNFLVVCIWGWLMPNSLPSSLVPSDVCVCAYASVRTHTIWAHMWVGFCLQVVFTELLTDWGDSRHIKELIITGFQLRLRNFSLRKVFASNILKLIPPLNSTLCVCVCVCRATHLSCKSVTVIPLPATAATT